MGISKNDLPHIFERFYKGKISTSNSIGIGLALAKTIVNKSNGTIQVESEEGKGSIFIIKYFK
ncbi:aTPase/histidine kinase/DNA gyrase B/HSP90 domain protein [Clostridium sp. CAG:1219]|nr:aTPase/histidine kinase/DNA gyrase B/HSP90 domain protein [Clostridium sp. CAG:1219]